MKKALGYARVSSDSQIENTSIDEQKERIQAFCKAQGWDLLEIYCDEGYSGGNTNRPGYQEIIRRVKEEKIDAVVVVKADRIHRNLKNLLIMIEDELEPNGTAFVSVSESFDSSSPYGKAMLQMMGSFSELERNMIKERTRSGRISTAKKQKYAGGQVPYGYEVVDGKVVINKQQAQVVKRIYSYFIDGHSTYWIAKVLNKEGIPTKMGKKWTPTQIRNILMTETYTGFSKYDGKKEKNNIQQKGVFPAIISRQKWNKVQSLLEKNRKRAQRGE